MAIRLTAMLNEPGFLFSHDEPDHLTRIHVRFELEALGFRIEERGTSLLATNSAIASASIPEVVEN